MEKSKSPAQDMNAMVMQGVEQGRGAMENYLKFFEQSMSATPLAGTELSKKLTAYTQQNVETAFAVAKKLTQAKDLQDLARIQTEYLQSQLKILTEQIKDLGETATKAAAVALKSPLNPST